MGVQIPPLAVSPAHFSLRRPHDPGYCLACPAPPLEDHALLRAERRVRFEVVSAIRAARER